MLARVRKKPAKTRAPKMLAPCECRNPTDSLKLSLKRIGRYVLDTNGLRVWLRWSNGLEEHTFIFLPSEFNALVRWWQKKQKVRK